MCNGRMNKQEMGSILSTYGKTKQIIKQKIENPENSKKVMRGNYLD